MRDVAGASLRTLIAVAALHAICHFPPREPAGSRGFVASDPVDLAVFALIVISAPFILWYMGRHLLSGFLPAYRLKVPKPGKLAGILSPHLQSFVAALPRRPNDPLAETCKP